jgi:Mg2+/citrate symporter
MTENINIDPPNNRRSTDSLRADIDSLYRAATSEEDKGAVNLFLRMYEELREITRTLHIQNEQAKNQEEQARRDRQSITDILKQHEQRMNEHENVYTDRVNRENIERAKIAGRNTIISWIVSTFAASAVALSIGVFWKYIALEKAFDKISNLDTEVKEHSSKLYELEKMMITESSLNAIRDNVDTLKKKSLRIEKLKVIQNSKVGN